MSSSNDCPVRAWYACRYADSVLDEISPNIPETLDENVRVQRASRLALLTRNLNAVLAFEPRLCEPLS